MESSQFNNDMYATATATSFKDIVHSTPQFAPPPRQTLPLGYDQSPDPSQHGSEGSAEMSIELGRGGKRGATRNYDELSSNGVFSFGNDHSQYEITGTPPIRPRTGQRKSDGALRKDASVRRATESARTKDTMRPAEKSRSVSDKLPRLDIEDEQQDLSQPTATFAIRGSRFTSSRHVSRSYSGIPSRFTAHEGLGSNAQTPQRPAVANATMQSATYTANQSFMLPDIPNLTELVSGGRHDGTPVMKRTGISRARFTSASYRPQGQQYLPVHGIPLPEEEKSIFAALQMAGDRVSQLEMEKMQMQKRVEHLENELYSFRAQSEAAAAAAGRSDSGIGSDEDPIEHKTFKDEKTMLRARVKALQDRLDKAEREASNAEITKTRVRKDRDALVVQLGNACYAKEELGRQNEELHREVERLGSENIELRDKLVARALSRGKDTAEPKRTRVETAAVQKVLPEALEQPAEMITSLGKRRSRVESRREVNDQNEDSANGRLHESSDQACARNLAARIEVEIQKHRDQVSAKAREARQSSRSNSVRSRSRSQHHKASAQQDEITSRRRSSISTKPVVPDDEMQTTTVEQKPTALPHSSKASNAKPLSSKSCHDEEDLTVLSDLDQEEVMRLRKKLELERKTGRLLRRSDISEPEDAQPLTSSARPPVPRKSSLKDMTVASGRDDTGRLSVHGTALDDLAKITKTVRVQSPHSSQELPEEQDLETGDVSILSNTSRRRRRTSSTEGMTSAFIIPDLTMHSMQTAHKESIVSCVQHKVASCTVCASSRGVEVEIPKPIPATERPELLDMTDATIRPVQTPADALATVIKTLEDEIKHLKMSRETQNRLYNQHDPAISKRKRQNLKLQMDRLTEQIERRSDQVYRLYDVLEGQKQQGRDLEMQEAEETLTSIGIDPAELSGTVGRPAPADLNGVEGLSGDESDELPWEGLSDVTSEAE